MLSMSNHRQEICKNCLLYFTISGDSSHYLHHICFVPFFNKKRKKSYVCFKIFIEFADITGTPGLEAADNFPAAKSYFGVYLI